MKGKQIVGIVVAGLVFTFVCTMSAFSNSLTSNVDTGKDLLTTLADGSSVNLPTESFIGEIQVQGAIMSTDTSSLFETASYNHYRTLELIDAYMNSSYNEGIILYVNSPGGGVYESDELYLKLKEYKDYTNRPVWTYMGSQACSGGYYIAMGSDHIVANRNCWTGSIGVIISLANYKELYDKLGIKTNYFTSGRNKTIGASDLDMTKEQEEIMQSLVDESYDQFVDIVARSRSMSDNQVRSFADGRIYTAKQALELNMIDGIDTYGNFVEDFKSQFSYNTIVYSPKIYSGSFFDSLFSMFDREESRSEAEIMLEFMKNEGNGVPMYYAELRK